NGILYTGSSGIWQTVWLEPVSRAHVEKVDITPNAGAGRFTIVPRVTGTRASRVELTARPSGGGPVVARASGQVGSSLTVAPAHPRLWSPASPYLYHFDIRLLDRNGNALDTVGSYAGLRSVGLVKDSKGRERVALNGRVLFQHGPLDQGFWPDGIYTAPTDSALRSDLAQTKALGFNMIRKHMKVEPDRWYYWADKLGLMVWQDMPSLPIDLSSPPGSNSPPTAAQRQNYQAELAEMIEAHRSTTSIVTWVAFNEGWGEFGTRQVAGDILAQDPTRLVDASSGVNCCYSKPDTGAGQIYDDHTYVGPGTPTAGAARAAVDGEYGGLGLVLPGHVWPGRPQAYEMEKTKAQLTKRYGQLSDTLANAVTAHGLSAGIYTQTTDVENEVNGLLSYDRRVVKANTAAVRAHNLRVIRAGSQ
ncbi:MAG: glycoside hydrolase family 2 protein, partial [Sciscionella sp.]